MGRYILRRKNVNPSGREHPSADGLIPALLLLLALGLALPAPGYTQEDSSSDQGASDSAQTSINWRTGRVLLNITAGLPTSAQALPAGRYHTEQRINRKLPIYTREALTGIAINSWHTIGSYMEEKDPGIFRPLEGLHQNLEKRHVTAARDLREITLRYALDIYPHVIDLFIKHETPLPPPSLLEYEPTKEYSGIIIYAKGELPVHGTNKTARLKPCLFPRIYNEEMTLLLDEQRVPPEVLRRWGMAAYTTDTEEDLFRNRIGDPGKEPLRIMARALFGKNHTNLIIPNGAARKILALSANRDLLRQGRILIIFDGEDLP